MLIQHSSCKSPSGRFHSRDKSRRNGQLPGDRVAACRFPARSECILRRPSAQFATAEAKLRAASAPIPGLHCNHHGFASHIIVYSFVPHMHPSEATLRRLVTSLQQSNKRNQSAPARGKMRLARAALLVSFGHRAITLAEPAAITEWPRICDKGIFSMIAPFWQCRPFVLFTSSSLLGRCPRRMCGQDDWQAYSKHGLNLTRPKGDR